MDRQLKKLKRLVEAGETDLRPALYKKLIRSGLCPRHWTSFTGEYWECSDCPQGFYRLIQLLGCSNWMPRHPPLAAYQLLSETAQILGELRQYAEYTWGLETQLDQFLDSVGLDPLYTCLIDFVIRIFNLVQLPYCSRSLIPILEDQNLENILFLLERDEEDFFDQLEVELINRLEIIAEPRSHIEIFFDHVPAFSGRNVADLLRHARLAGQLGNTFEGYTEVGFYPFSIDRYYLYFAQDPTCWANLGNFDDIDTEVRLNIANFAQNALDAHGYVYGYPDRITATNVTQSGYKVAATENLETGEITVDLHLGASETYRSHLLERIQQMQYKYPNIYLRIRDVAAIAAEDEFFQYWDEQQEEIDF